MSQESRIRDEYETLVRKFGVPENEALASLRRKYGRDAVSHAFMRRIGELKARMSNVSCRSAVVSLSVPPSGRYTKGVLGDETGLIPFFSFRRLHVAQGDTVEIIDAAVRPFRGVPTLYINDGTVVRRSEDRIEVRNSIVSLAEMLRRDVNFMVRFEADVITVRSAVRKFHRCSICGRMIHEGVCRTHGRVRSTPDLHLRCVLDDSSASLEAIIGGETLASLLGEPVASLAERDSGETRNAVASLLVGRCVEGEGTVLLMRDGKMMNVERMEVQRDISGKNVAHFLEVVRYIGLS